MLHYLFGFSGRINRAKIWLFILIVILAWIVIGIALGVAIAAQGPAADTAAASPPPADVLAKLGIFLIVCALLYLLTLWAGLAVTTKRLHDRNKSAWWLLVFYILPLVLNIPRTVAMVHAFQDGTFMKLAEQGQAMAIGGPVAIIASGAASLISLWAFVELYCLAGTTGSNRYGPDPLAGRV
jgi:uncharacterized membrane protein YhaH (DUF805 family)